MFINCEVISKACYLDKVQDLWTNSHKVKAIALAALELLCFIPLIIIGIRRIYLINRILNGSDIEKIICLNQVLKPRVNGELDIKIIESLMNLLKKDDNSAFFNSIIYPYLTTPGLKRDLIIKFLKSDLNLIDKLFAQTLEKILEQEDKSSDFYILFLRKMLQKRELPCSEEEAFLFVQRLESIDYTTFLRIPELLNFQGLFNLYYRKAFAHVEGGLPVINASLLKQFFFSPLDEIKEEDRLAILKNAATYLFYLQDEASLYLLEQISIEQLDFFEKTKSYEDYVILGDRRSGPILEPFKQKLRRAMVIKSRA